MLQLVASIARSSRLLVLGLLLLAHTASASEQEGAARWVPSLAIVTHVTFQDWKAGAQSEVCRGCTLPNPAAEPLRPPVDGDDRDVTPLIGGQLELMTPELPLPGAPRFFVGAEATHAFGTERKVAQDGEPSRVGSPAPEEIQDTTPFGDDVATGQGSEVLAKMQDGVYGASLGVALPFELYGRPLRVKAGIAWIRYEIEVKGLVVDAQCQPRGNGTECNTNPPLNGFLRETRLGASKTEDFHGVGPAIDLEMDTGRIGPIGVALSLGARFYRTVGDDDVALSAGPIAIDDQLGQDSAAAGFRFEVDDWMYRIGIGLRLRWLGQEE